MYRWSSFKRYNSAVWESFRECRSDCTDRSSDVEHNRGVAQHQISNANSGLKDLSLLRALLKIKVIVFARDLNINARNVELAGLQITCHRAESSQQR